MNTSSGHRRRRSPKAKPKPPLRRNSVTSLMGSDERRAHFRNRALVSLTKKIVEMAALLMLGFSFFLALDGRLPIPVFEDYYSRKCKASPEDCVGILDSLRDLWTVCRAVLVGAGYHLVEGRTRHFMVQCIVIADTMEFPRYTQLFRLVLILFPRHSAAEPAGAQPAAGVSLLTAKIKDIATGRVAGEPAGNRSTNQCIPVRWNLVYQAQFIWRRMR